MAIKTFPEMALAISAFSSYSSLFPTTNHMGSLKVSYNCHLVYFFAFTLPWIPFPVLLFFSFNPHPRTYSLIVRERERREERGMKKIDGLPPILHPNQDWTLNLGICPDRELKPWVFSVQDSSPTNLSHTSQSFALAANQVHCGVITLSSFTFIVT